MNLLGKPKQTNQQARTVFASAGQAILDEP